ncbi:MAG: hypothetical protein JNL11_01570 [Bdellovibrionaceae bacterium]|nr:hypothetical protein [Pseudobdellovibrionaceae bacterium]
MRAKLLITLLASLLVSISSQAYVLQKKNANAVLFQLDGNPVAKGQEFFIVDQNNKAKVQVRVELFNSKQAKATVIKGNLNTVQIGWTLRPVSRRGTANVPDAAEVTTQVNRSALSKHKWGAIGSYMMSSMNAKFSFNGVNQTAAMSGSSIGALGYYDYAMNKNLEIRGMAGLETFDAKQAKETAVCDKGLSKECNVKINYLSMYALGKYNLTKTKNKFWIGGGLGYLLAIGKSSTVLDTSLITSNQVLTIGVGMDLGIGNKNTMPLALDYSLFPSSPTVSASIISLKVGFGFGQ